MKNLTQKRSFLFALFLLMSTFYTLHASKSAYQSIMQLQKTDGVVGLPRVKRKLLVHGYCRKYDVPKEVGLFIIYFVYDNPLQYKNKTLPNDLSGQDLSGFDFTGCQFTYTNLTDANLANVVLLGTVCDYQAYFQSHFKENKLDGGHWYKNNLCNDLKSITEVYAKLNSNAHKAKLLQVACGFSCLPFYGDTDFYIKVEYWSSELLQLKQVLGKPYGDQLVCSLERNLTWDARNWCWTTKYPQGASKIAIQRLHANFDIYLKDFTDGLKTYQCSSTQRWGFDYYKGHITKNVEGLKKAYPMIKDKQLQKEACAIAHALSKSYQIGKGSFLYHYLFCQNRLIQLKNSVDVGVKNEILYNFSWLLAPHRWN